MTVSIGNKRLHRGGCEINHVKCLVVHVTHGAYMDLSARKISSCSILKLLRISFSDSYSDSLPSWYLPRGITTMVLLLSMPRLGDR